MTKNQKYKDTPEDMGVTDSSYWGLKSLKWLFYLAMAVLVVVTITRYLFHWPR